MNTSAAVDWLPALAVLALGMVVGTVLVWRMLAASRSAARDVPVQVRDLQGKRDALLRQLRELEDTASKRTPEQLARERYALELEAGQVLLALDERGAHAGAERAPATAAGSGHSGKRRRGTSRPAVPAASDRAGVRGFLWGIGSATALLLLGLLVYQAAKPREEGGSVTGNLPAGSRSMSTGGGESADGEEAQIEAALAHNPDDVEARLAHAHLLLAHQDFMGVWKETGRVLERSPGNPQALAYQAIVRLAMGQAEVAVDLLKKAVATDPNLIDGYVYLAVGYVRMGRMRDAEAAIARGSERFPDRAADFRRLLADLQKQEAPMANATAASGAANPHAGLTTPGTGTSRPATSAISRRSVSGTVDIDPSLRSAIPPGAVLFVFVREAGAAGGPPVAVKRLPPTFPAVFELSEADSMMGQPFPDPLLIEARLDSDGDPTTRPPTDPKARLDRVKAGRSDVHLVLR